MATHAGIKFASEQPTFTKKWELASNSLILLAVETEEDLRQLYEFAEGKSIPVSAFFEPDIHDELTAVALFADEEIGEMLDALPLALRDPGDARWQRELALRKETAA